MNSTCLPPWIFVAPVVTMMDHLHPLAKQDPKNVDSDDVGILYHLVSRAVGNIVPPEHVGTGHGEPVATICMVTVGSGTVWQRFPSISDTVPCSNQYTTADTPLDLIFFGDTESSAVYLKNSA